MLCSFCGLETGRASSHETQEACIDALREQVTHLKNVLEHARRPGEDPLVARGVDEARGARSDVKSHQEA
jgi:hypothetical protein